MNLLISVHFYALFFTSKIVFEIDSFKLIKTAYLNKYFYRVCPKKQKFHNNCLTMLLYFTIHEKGIAIALRGSTSACWPAEGILFFFLLVKEVPMVVFPNPLTGDSSSREYVLSKDLYTAMDFGTHYNDPSCGDCPWYHLVCLSVDTTNNQPTMLPLHCNRC